MKKNVKIENLDCAVCAAKLEKSIAKIPGIRSAILNFASGRLNLDIDDACYEVVVQKIKEAASREDACISGL
jgi:copper chaperone CopZ